MPPLSAATARDKEPRTGQRNFRSTHVCGGFGSVYPLSGGLLATFSYRIIRATLFFYYDYFYFTFICCCLLLLGRECEREGSANDALQLAAIFSLF